MTGNVAPETEKPAPVTAPAFTVTATVPEDVKVTDFVTAVFSATLPNDRAVALTFSVGVAAFNCRANPLEAPPALAEIVADCAVVTDVTVALNDALADAAGTVTEAGTVTALLLLERLTATPPLGADPRQRHRARVGACSRHRRTAAGYGAHSWRSRRAGSA